jgi:uncharacterized protein (DUF1330 family)
MNQISRLVVALGLGMTVGVGGVTLNSLHAQAGPAAYSIIEVEVIDPEGFKAFAKRNAENLASAGAHFIVRNGRTVASEGTPPKTVFVIAWDNLDQATTYFNSARFKELIPLRDKSAKVRLFHVEGVPK